MGRLAHAYEFILFVLVVQMVFGHSNSLFMQSLELFNSLVGPATVMLVVLPHPDLLWSGVVIVDRDSTTLARSSDNNAMRVNCVARPRGLDRTDCVREDAAVIVGFGLKNTVRHETGIMTIRAFGRNVRCVTLSPSTPLTARVYYKMGKTGAGPYEPVEWKSAAPAVSNVFNDTGGVDVNIIPQPEVGANP